MRPAKKRILIEIKEDKYCDNSMELVRAIKGLDATNLVTATNPQICPMTMKLVTVVITVRILGYDSVVPYLEIGWLFHRSYA